MQDNVSVLIATLVAVIIIVLFPIYNIATRNDSVANNMVVRATTNFVDEVRNKGYIDKESYGQFLNELDKTGNTYNVELEVYKPYFIETASKEYEVDYEVKYTKTIIADMENSELFKDEDSIKKSDVYYLDSEDKFYVRVKNTNITQAQILLDRLLGGKQDERIVVNYGGIVYTNEWAYGENAETSLSNISLSRPFNQDGKEFKYEYITDVYDPVLDENKSIYGIAVRLSDYIAGGSSINFRLKYSDVYQFTDGSGHVLTSSVARENHIRDYIEAENFTVDKEDIIVSEISAPSKNSKGMYDSEYIITLTNITYNYENNPYVEGRVKVHAGSAYTGAGEVAEVNSKSFIITYEISKPSITVISNPKSVIEDEKVTPVSGGTEITFTATGKVQSEDIKIKNIVFEITNNNEVVMNETISADENGKASIKYKFEEGIGSITAYAVDSRGLKSETIGYGFVIMTNNEYQSIDVATGFAELLTIPIRGATIDSYRFIVSMRSHSSSYSYDWWRVSGLVEGTENTWVILNPSIDISSVNVASLSIEDVKRKNANEYVYYKFYGGSYLFESKIKNGTYTLANRARGDDFDTGYISISNPSQKFTQLKFEYRTDPTHDGKSCLNNAQIKYEVNYNF